MANIFDVFIDYKIGGVVPLWVIVAIGVMGLIVYLIATRSPREKTYKPIDMKVKTRLYFNTFYKFFGETINKPLYNETGRKQIGFVIGMMPMVWNNRLKRYESIVKSYDPKKLKEKMETAAMEVYNVPFESLTPDQKKSVRELSKSEMKDEYAELEVEAAAAGGEQKVKIKGFKKEVTFDEPVDMQVLKVCPNGFFNRLLKRGWNYWIVEDKHLTAVEGVLYLADVQRAPFFNEFIFSKNAKAVGDNIGYMVDHENQIQALANVIPREMYISNRQLSSTIAIMEKSAKIEGDKYKAQKEGNQD